MTMKRWLVLLGMCVVAVGIFFVSRSTLAAGEKGYCWCQKPNGDGTFTCENHTTKGGVADFIASEQECNQFCPTLGPGVISASWDPAPNFYARSEKSCKLKDCPRLFGWCWCKATEGQCENHTLDDSCKTIITDLGCQQYCTSKGQTETNWDPVNNNAPNNGFVDRTGAADQSGKCPSGAASVKGGGATTYTARKGSPTKLFDPLGGHEDVISFISRIIRAFLGIIGSIALLAFVYGGFLWLTGDLGEGQVKKAKTVLKSATIGLLIIFFSYMAVDLFLSAFTKSYEPDRPPAEQP